MATNGVDTSPNGGSDVDLLAGFITNLDDYAHVLTSTALEASADEETRALIGATAESWSSQLVRVTGFAREHYERLNVAQRSEVDEFLRIQDGVAMVQRGAETTRSAAKSGWFKKFLKWMLKWFREIKKVLREIIALVLDALGISFPKWLKTIFLLIDELHVAIGELLSDVFGLDSARFAAEAAKDEVAYLSQLEAVERLRQMRTGSPEAREA